MSQTYVCANEPNLTTWIDVKVSADEIIPTQVWFKQGQLVLEDEKEIAAFEALLNHPRCRIGTIVRKLDKAAAEEFAKNFQSERVSAVRGPATSTAVHAAHEGQLSNAVAKMQASGIPESEIDVISKQLSTEESLMVTEDSTLTKVSKVSTKKPNLNVKAKS